MHRHKPRLKPSTPCISGRSAQPFSGFVPDNDLASHPSTVLNQSKHFSKLGESSKWHGNHNNKKRDRYAHKAVHLKVGSPSLQFSSEMAWLQGPGLSGLQVAQLYSAEPLSSNRLARWHQEQSYVNTRETRRKQPAKAGISRGTEKEDGQEVVLLSPTPKRIAAKPFSALGLGTPNRGLWLSLCHRSHHCDPAGSCLLVQSCHELSALVRLPTRLLICFGRHTR